MTHHDKTHGLSLVDAVDTLSAIADLDLTEEIELDEALQKKQHRIVISEAGSHHMDLDVVKNIFRTILNHLKTLYEEDSSYVTDQKKTERVKTIMSLVGEASAKLNKFTSLFVDTQSKSVHDLKEFKQLQEFYITRIARKIDEGMLGKWILGISGRKIPEEAKAISPKKIHSKHVFIDLEGVKKDSEYELFFIRKEDGTRFFNPRLIRSIKLVCDFGSYFKGEKNDNPFADLQLLADRSIYMSAKNILQAMRDVICKFYGQVASHKQNEMVLNLNKAIIALMMAANSSNLLRNNPAKSCFEYFTDFQVFLRDALHSREYQRILAYPQQTNNSLSICLANTVQTMAYCLYVAKPGIQEIISYIENIIHEAVHERSGEHLAAVNASKQCWNHLASDYAAMNKLIKHHPNGHLKKILQMVEEGNYKFYDPLMQHNMPMELYHLYCGDLKMINLKVPAPVYQETIQKAAIIDEFKAFLRFLKMDQTTNKFLVVNFQDRTSWREHARSESLEDLQNNSEFSKILSVVTIPKDTEFYNQEPPYDKCNQANVFIQQLKDHLTDETAGFYLPKEISKKEYVKFLDQAAKIILSIFFHSKNVLTKDERQGFIEIIYFFIELKMLDLIKPNFFSFTCKDGIDVSSASNALLFAFLTLINQDKFSDGDREFLNLMIYGMPLLVRERLMLHDRFTRMLMALKVFESAKTELGRELFLKVIKEAFVLLYDTPILESKILPSRS